ncbi:MAG: RNA-binding S4 domain-containing protein [Parvibaculum sp.]|nr:RNA-binding S4 domain-containing protein [Parvibaculum sp.]
MATGEPKPAEQRIDRWLWFARILKSRTLAASLVSSGKLRVNTERIDKPARHVKPGDVLTFPLGNHVRVLKVLDAGTRRGPAPEAQRLYEDLAPLQAKPATDELPDAARERGAGRPTKKERRDRDAFHGFHEDEK